MGSAPPTRSNAPFLEHAQQLHLHRHGDVADLVEEQRPLVGQLEAADALAVGAGVRTLLVAEELAFEEVFVECAAVDGHERTGAERGRGLVDRPGDLLLAGAGFAADEDGGGGIRDLPDQLEHIVHAWAFAQHVVERMTALELRAQRRHFVLEARVRSAALHQQAQVLRVGRLGQEVVGAHPHGLDRVLDAAVPRGHDHRDRQLFGLDGLDQLHAREFWHPQVRDDQTVRLLAEQRQALGPVFGRIDRQPQTHLEQLLQRFARVLQVLDNQHALGRPTRFVWHRRCST